MLTIYSSLLFVVVAQPVSGSPPQTETLQYESWQSSNGRFAEALSSHSSTDDNSLSRTDWYIGPAGELFKAVVSHKARPGGLVESTFEYQDVDNSWSARYRFSLRVPRANETLGGLVEAAANGAVPERFDGILETSEGEVGRVSSIDGTLTVKEAEAAGASKIGQAKSGLFEFTVDGLDANLELMRDFFCLRMTNPSQVCDDLIPALLLLLDGDQSSGRSSRRIGSGQNVAEQWTTAGMETLREPDELASSVLRTFSESPRP